MCWGCCGPVNTICSPASLTLPWAWGQHGALLMLLGFSRCFVAISKKIWQKNITKYWSLRSCSKFESRYTRVKTCPECWNISFTLTQLKVNVMFLCFFPFSLMLISNGPKFCSLNNSYGLCFVSSALVHQQDQSLRLEGTGKTPCEDWVINLQ